MMKRYSQMTPQELQDEIAVLEEQKRQVEFPSQMAIIESKIYTAKSYTLLADSWVPGLYRVIGYDQPMRLEYLNGIMAWGTIDKEEVSFPLAMLQRIREA